MSSVFDRHPDLKETSDLLVARRRVALASDTDDIGRPLAAAAALRLVEQTGAALTVMGAMPYEAAWTSAFKAEGHATHLRYLTITRAAKVPSLLDTEHVIVADMTKMTLDTATATWRNIAPVLRMTPTIILYVPMTNWPKNLPHVELISHFDKAVFLHASELAV